MENKTEIRPQNIINFKALSTFLTGSGGNIRAGNIPEKYKKDINSLVKYIDKWMKSEKEVHKKKGIAKTEVFKLCEVKKISHKLKEYIYRYSETVKYYKNRKNQVYRLSTEGGQKTSKHLGDAQTKQIFSNIVAKDINDTLIKEEL